jgi:hypothetical protein
MFQIEDVEPTAIYILCNVTVPSKIDSFHKSFNLSLQFMHYIHYRRWTDMNKN